MTLGLSQSTYAAGINVPASFLGVGGTGPYTYSVLGGGAGGTINAATGAYTAPAVVPTEAAQQFDTVRVTDSLTATATAQILVGDALLLFCDVVARGMGLDPSRVWIWDQKIFQPTDSGLYIAVAESEAKMIGSANSSPVTGNTQNQYAVFHSKLEVTLISRSVVARLSKGLFVASLSSAYAEQQQKFNGFQIAKNPTTFANVTPPDGAAIPYRYQTWVNFNYTEYYSSAQQYFDTFNNPPQVVVNQ